MWFPPIGTLGRGFRRQFPTEETLMGLALHRELAVAVGRWLHCVGATQVWRRTVPPAEWHVFLLRFSKVGWARFWVGKQKTGQ